MTSTREAALARAEMERQRAQGAVGEGAHPPQYVRVARAAEILDCTPRTVYRMIRDGDLPAIVVGQRSLRISLADLDQLREQRRHDPGATASAARAALATQPRPRAREPRGRFARKARGLG